MIDETRFRETSTADVNRPRIAVESIPAPSSAAVEYRPIQGKLTSWGAIWAGVVIAIGVQTILTVFGMAVGISVLHARGAANAGEMGAGAGIWWVISGIISLFLGGLAAGWLSAPRRAFDGAVHGFIMWCVLTGLSAALITTLGGVLLGGSLSALGNSDVTQSPSGAIDRSQAPYIQQQPPSITDTTGAAIDRTRTNVTTNQPPVNYQVGEVKRASVAASWWTFITLLLGAVAAVVGGSMGPIRDEEFSRRGRWT